MGCWEVRWGWWGGRGEGGLVALRGVGRFGPGGGGGALPL